MSIQKHFPEMKPEATADKCEAILRKMLEFANSGKPVTLDEDWGGNSATIIVDGGHTHVGIPGEDGTWEIFVDNLYNSLHGGPGLSWHPSSPESSSTSEDL
jgi:hypothetical protein